MRLQTQINKVYTNNISNNKKNQESGKLNINTKYFKNNNK